MHEAMGKLTSGLRISPDLTAAWQRVSGSSDGASSYITATFDAVDKTLVGLRDVGDGGYLAAHPTLREEDVTFLVAPFYVGGLAKWFFVTYVGSAVRCAACGVCDMCVVVSVFLSVCA